MLWLWVLQKPCPGEVLACAKLCVGRQAVGKTTANRPAATIVARSLVEALSEPPASRQRLGDIGDATASVGTAPANPLDDPDAVFQEEPSEDEPVEGPFEQPPDADGELLPDTPLQPSSGAQNAGAYRNHAVGRAEKRK